MTTPINDPVLDALKTAAKEAARKVRSSRREAAHLREKLTDHAEIESRQLAAYAALELAIVARSENPGDTTEDGDHWRLDHQ